MTTQLHQKRFGELLAQLDDLWNSQRPKQRFTGKVEPEIDGNALLEWTVKARNLIGGACGTDSEHYRSFVENEKAGAYETYIDVLGRLKAVFLAAKEDYEGGYLRSLKAIVQSEVFDSQLEQANELLSNGYTAAAAVIGGVVLETTLRELCDRNSIRHGKLDRMNAELAKVGAITRLELKRNTALAEIRNAAAHGKMEGITHEDVNVMLRDVERFVSEKIPT